ncbi:L,D-transpeptidase family protein [Streptomyces sp. NPDC088116]|uniref:L,D-transpeptidase family protein n=1 Tax=Streptomyces sp. NPDC088116 TaxID=3365825 RepID=UPI0037FBAF8D
MSSVRSLLRVRRGLRFCPADLVGPAKTGRTGPGRPRLVAALLATGLLLTGCVGVEDTADNAGSAPGGPKASGADSGAGRADSGGPDSGGPRSGGADSGGGRSGKPVLEAQTVEPEEIPGLGPATRAKISDETTQAVVVTGAGRDSDRSTVVIHERDPVTGWQRASDAWPAHNAVRGWTDDHVQGDLRSPIGVFGLTDAGGKLPDPGSRLPYDRGPAFEATGDGVEGEPLEGSFDYVVAINYNRMAGTSPLDWTRPLGEEKGGGIWLHVDHGGPTQGCVSLPRRDMKELLRALDPRKRPVVVMGDADSLSR